MKSLVLAIALFAACAHTPTPAPSADAGGPITCASVCDHGAIIGCLWAQPTPKGASCERVCLNATNVGQPWSLDCIQRLSSCDSALACQ
jgi:hypothetical protein